jgi:uncharacterized membrane protein
MERIPAWLLTLGVVVFAGLAIWSATDENWAGLIAGAVLTVLCLVGLSRKRSAT